MSVVPDRGELSPKLNTEKIGFFKREELNERASQSAVMRSDPKDLEMYFKRNVRIFQRQRSHT